jgi:hypothetical protein
MWPIELLGETLPWVGKHVAVTAVLSGEGGGLEIQFKPARWQSVSVVRGRGSCSVSISLQMNATRHQHYIEHNNIPDRIIHYYFQFHSIHHHHHHRHRRRRLENYTELYSPN